MYGKEMEGAETQMSDVIPSTEDMMKQLTDEVAEDIGAARPSKTKEKAESEGGVKEQIGEARSRLRKLMEDEK